MKTHEELWVEISTLWKRTRAAIKRKGYSEAEVLANYRSKLLGEYYRLGGKKKTVDLKYAFKSFINMKNIIDDRKNENTTNLITNDCST